MSRGGGVAAGSLVAILVSLMLGAGGASAATATVSGTVTTPASKIPSAKTSQANVLAMNVDSGAYGDADTADSRGRYSLKLQPGKWALISSLVVPGKRASSFLSAAIVAKPGQHRALPLTLKQFKKPRKKKRRKKPGHHRRAQPAAGASNINPRDGREYPGVAIAVKEFGAVGAGSEIAVGAAGMDDMLVTDLVNSTKCAITVVEWARRGEIEQEIALQHSEYFDPATAVEEGHLIDPEIFVNGRFEDRRGTPQRTAMVAWLEDAKAGAKISREVSVVDLGDRYFDNETRLAKLIVDLICARSAPTPTPEAPTPPPPPPPPVDTYSGSFSGVAEADGVHIEWSGNVVFDAAQDSATPPPGAPPGEYREYTVTSGSFFTAIEGETEEECVYSASGSRDLEPGFANGQLTVQLDVDSPAYYLFLLGNGSVPGTSSCGEGTDPYPVYPFLSYTKEAVFSGSRALNGSEAHPSLIPGSFSDTAQWNLAPG